MKPSYQVIVLATLCFIVGFALSEHVNAPAIAQNAKTIGPQGPTYQISAFRGSEGQSPRYGAYVLNTLTGKVWLIKESQGMPTPILGTPPNSN